ncbi:tonsoku-like protein [Salarias fasciatus]|uniref:tonsoku-like protein n=1 Tax=Salarias fasciatus TaxID=181472 RepID=UPI001176EC60|nr:tonsoku-like protein [Salarias fasciatus]
MSSSREIRLLQKAKSKAQASSDLREEASLCNQLGEVLSRSGDYAAAIREHQQELSLSEALSDVIGRAVAHRKIGECYAEMGNIDAALKHQHCHLDLARSVRDSAEEQRALATIGRTYLFRYESDQSARSLEQAGDAFRQSLAIVDERLEGTVPQREISEMKARLFLNLGLVCDHLGEPQRCSDFIRRSVFIAEKSQLLEDLYRANFNLGNIFFRNGQQSSAVRCLEQAKECARKTKDKFSESECFHCIGKVQLSLGDFAAARRSLKKALQLGSQQPLDRQAVKKSFKYADRGWKLEEELEQDRSPLQAVELWERLADLCCKVGCFGKALEAYRAQLKAAEALGRPGRELAVIHVSLAATHADLRQHQDAVQHYREELALRQGSPAEDCSTWLNLAAALEEGGGPSEDVDSGFQAALRCAEASGRLALQRRALRLWTASQQRRGSAGAAETELKLRELSGPDGGGGDEDEDEEEDEEDSEALDSDVVLSDSDEDLEGYDRMVAGRRTAGRWNKRNEKGETFLHRACIDGNLRQVQSLLDQGHPVNPRDYCGWTPLHEACNHGHLEVVALLLDCGANINDPGGPLCEGVTPLHDALACGNLKVAQLLVQRGASVTLRNSKGEAARDTLLQWQRTYSRELDQETRLECRETERLLRRAASGAEPGAAAPAEPSAALRDSQLFDAEDSEPPVHRDRPGRGSARRPRPRGTAATLLYGEDGSDSDGDDSDRSPSPLRPVRPRDPPAAAPGPDGGAETARDQYHSAIRGLGSAKTLLQGHAQPRPPRTPPAASGRAALVPEDECLQDDWLEDDLLDGVPRKKRRLQREEPGAAPPARGQRHHPGAAVPPSSSRGLPPSRSRSARPQQLKMTQIPGTVRLGRREVSRPHSPPVPEDPRPGPGSPPPAVTPHQPSPQSSGAPRSLAPPIRMRVRVLEDVFLIPVPQSRADSCTVSWLCEQAAQRYYQERGLLPRLSLQKDGALLSPQDLLLSVLHTNEEVLAEVCSWDLPPLPERYRKACQSLAAAEDRRLSRLCEAQDGSPSVWLCGLSLPPSSLAPLLRALKLQASLTELRLHGNRLTDALLPELVAAAVTMPRLRLLDVSSNLITAEGLEKAADALKAQTHPAFPCLEDLDLGLNPLGDRVSESLSCLLSHCPLLSRMSLQACSLTARFLQQHRILLAHALTASGHLKSLNLSHNALGSAGFELLLKTLPLRCLTHLDLSAVCRGASDCPGVEHLAQALSQEECSLTHLSLASNGLTDSSVATLSRCLPSCPQLVSLDLSGNPGVGSAGLRSVLASVRETRPALTLLNLQGCPVSGPWDPRSVDGLSRLVLDLRLCSQSLNKLDRRALKQTWDQEDPHGASVDRGTKFLLCVSSS